MLADAASVAQRTESEAEIALGAVASIAASAQRRASRLATGSASLLPTTSRPSIRRTNSADRRARTAPATRSVSYSASGAALPTEAGGRLSIQRRPSYPNPNPNPNPNPSPNPNRNRNPNPSPSPSPNPNNTLLTRTLSKALAQLARTRFCVLGQ